LGDDQTTPCKIYRTSDALRVTGPNNRFQFGTAEYIADAGVVKATIHSTLLPSSDNSLDLGSSSLRWDDVYASNGTIQTSDIRDKENINQLNYGLTDIMELNPVSYNWKGKSTEDKKLGLIAQELLDVIPEVVKTHDEEIVDEETGETQTIELERYGVYYSDLIPVLINGIQDQQKLIDELNRTTQEQQNLINSLTEEVEKLKENIN